MGRCPKRTNQRCKKGYKQNKRQIFELRHIDLLWDDIRKNTEEVHNVEQKFGPVGNISRVELDDDLPATGRFHCIACSRYFQSQQAHESHNKTKPHKKRVKMLSGQPKPHVQRDADSAGGMGAPDNGQPRPVAMQA